MNSFNSLSIIPEPISDDPERKEAERNYLTESSEAPLLHGADKIRQLIKEEGKRLARASRAVGWMSLVGFVFGLSLVLLQEFHHLKDFPDWRHYAGIIIEHVGLGFIVSSLAVFGYEWRSHAKEAFELSEKLRATIDRVDDIRTAVAFNALESALLNILGGRGKRLREHIYEIVKASYQLEKQQAPETVQYLNVISRLLDLVVKKNVQSLANLSDGGEWNFDVPAAAAEMTDRILGAHMKVLKKGQSYDVVSDVMQWRDDRLSYFKKHSKLAVRRGVKIRRVFNMFSVNLPMSHDPARQQVIADALEILQTHLTDSQNLRGYKVRFFWRDELNKMGNLSNRKKDNIKGVHFGLFKDNNSSRIVRVVVGGDSPSDLKLSYANNSAFEVELFDSIWNASTDLNSTLIDKIRASLKSAAAKQADYLTERGELSQTKESDAIEDKQVSTDVSQSL